MDGVRRGNREQRRLADCDLGCRPIFRNEVRGLLRRVISGKVLGTEWTFGEAIERLEITRGEVPHVAGTQVGPTVESTSFEDPRLEALARDGATANPPFAVLNGWELLLGAVHEVLASALAPIDLQAINRTTSTTELAGLKRLRANGAIDNAMVEMYVRMRDLRNQVAHGQSNPSVGEAVAFMENLDWFLARLRRVKGDGDS